MSFGPAPQVKVAVVSVGANGMRSSFIRTAHSSDRTTPHDRSRLSRDRAHAVNATEAAEQQPYVTG